MAVVLVGSRFFICVSISTSLLLSVLFAYILNYIFNLFEQRVNNSKIKVGKFLLQMKSYLVAVIIILAVVY